MNNILISSEVTATLLRKQTTNLHCQKDEILDEMYCLLVTKMRMRVKKGWEEALGHPVPETTLLSSDGMEMYPILMLV